MSETVGLLYILFEAIVDDPNGREPLAISVHRAEAHACLELFEHLARHNLKAFAALVVFVDRFLGVDDRSVPLKAGLLQNIEQPEISRCEKSLRPRRWSLPDRPAARRGDAPDRLRAADCPACLARLLAFRHRLPAPSAGSLKSRNNRRSGRCFCLLFTRFARAIACISVWAFSGLSRYRIARLGTSKPVSHIAQTMAMRNG